MDDKATIARLQAEIDRLRAALHKTPVIAFEFGEAFRVKHQSDYAQGYADASDVISMMLRKNIEEATK